MSPMGWFALLVLAPCLIGAIVVIIHDSFFVDHGPTDAARHAADAYLRSIGQDEDSRRRRGEI